MQKRGDVTGQTGSGDTVVICGVGDVSPRRADYGEAPESLFSLVHERIKEADISFCQFEKILSNRGCLQYQESPTWRSRVRPENVRAVVFAGFDVVSHASNHCFDFGPEALVESVELLRSNGIWVVGAGKDIADARKPAILERKGTRVGFLAYNSVLLPEWEAREDKPGCAPIRVSTYYEAQEYQAGTPPKVITVPREDDVLAMEEDIRRLRDQVDILVVSMHWGIHHIPGILAMYQPVVGHRAIDAGADLILGHHAHLVKGIEVYKGRVIFYSLGNFASEMPRQARPPGVYSKDVSTTYQQGQQERRTKGEVRPRDRQYTVMARCIAIGKTITSVSFLPGWINERSEPELLSRKDPRFDEVLRYVEWWCGELGTGLKVEGDEVMIHCE
ncbi:MAG: CapA family protein [Chloroflexi bacterium]|nr:CapA family protein [Chloroflexota bacterium]